MDKLNIRFETKHVNTFKRETKHTYYQLVNYEHFYNDDNPKLIDNKFVVTLSDQFFDSQTNQELINTIETAFYFDTPENILLDFHKPDKQHKLATDLMALLTFKARELIKSDTTLKKSNTIFKELPLPDLTAPQVKHRLELSFLFNPN